MQIQPDPNYLEDGRGRFTDQIGVSAPRGMREDVRHAASMSGTTSASFIRDAITERVRLVLKQADTNG